MNDQDIEAILGSRRPDSEQSYEASRLLVRAQLSLLGLTAMPRQGRSQAPDLTVYDLDTDVQLRVAVRKGRTRLRKADGVTTLRFEALLKRSVDLYAAVVHPDPNDPGCADIYWIDASQFEAGTRAIRVDVAGHPLSALVNACRWSAQRTEDVVAAKQ